MAEQQRQDSAARTDPLGPALVLLIGACEGEAHICCPGLGARTTWEPGNRPHSLPGMEAAQGSESPQPKPRDGQQKGSRKSSRRS